VIFAELVEGKTGDGVLHGLASSGIEVYSQTEV
jgi:hypothetical protein